MDLKINEKQKFFPEQVNVIKKTIKKKKTRN